MISVIYENEDLIVVEKPHNEDFHTNDGASGFFQRVKETLNFSELFPIHRLDKVTSGLLIMAKNRSTARFLGAEFEQHRVRKLYLAIAEGKPKKKQGLVKGDMERSRRSSWRLLRSNNNPAITRFISCSTEEGVRGYLLCPQTGKTHQLRVSMKSIGAPILGDNLYGGCESDRVYLHAFALSLTLENAPKIFCCLPTEGSKFDAFLNHDWLLPVREPINDRQLQSLFDQFSS